MDLGMPTPFYITTDKISKPKDECVDFERAIQLCGYGRFHYGFVLLCGAIFLCVGFQNGANAYILPSAECDLRMTSEEKGLLNVAFLAGGVLSAALWGLFADAYGRKKILVGTLLLDAVVTFASSLSQSFTVLLAFRALNGFTIGAPGSLVYTYIGEFHAEKQRAKSICYVGFFWTLAWLILPGLAWVVIPLSFTVNFYGLLYNSWRLFLAVLGIPTVLVAVVATGYPESPKFLVTQGRSDEALRILRRIYASNTGRAEREYPVKTLLTNNRAYSTKRESKDDSGVLVELLGNIWRQIRCITSPRILKYVILCTTIYFTNMFGYYGLGLWLPELFNRFETYYKLYPNTSVSVCELIATPDAAGATAEAVVHSRNASVLIVDAMLPDSTQRLTVSCNGNIDQQVFINTLTVNAVCLLGNIASGYLSDRVGRRTMPVTTMLLAGVFGFAIYFVRTSVQNLTVACLYSLAIATANFVIGSVVVDIFPTQIGGVTICLVVLFGRLGAISSNLLFGMLLDISCEVPIFLIGAVVISGGLLSFLLPLATIEYAEPKNKDGVRTNIPT